MRLSLLPMVIRANARAFSDSDSPLASAIWRAAMLSRKLGDVAA